MKIFQIGNESWCGRFPETVKAALGTGEPEALAPWYRECLLAYAEAMRAVDPGIELIIDGEMGLGGVERFVLPDPEIRARVRYAALHAYALGSMREAKRDGALVAGESMRPEDWWLAWVSMPGAYDQAGLCRAYGDRVAFVRSLGYDLAATEWNWNGWKAGEPALGPDVDWRHAAAIGVAGFLNGLLRQAGAVRIANQSMLIGHCWNIAAIRIDAQGRTPVHANAQGAATTFYQHHRGDRVLAVQADGVPVAGQPYAVGWCSALPQMALLDAVATRSDGAVFLHVVNRSWDRDFRVAVDCRALAPAGSEARLHLLQGTAREALATTRCWMRESSRAIPLASGRAEIDFRARTVAILELPLPGKDRSGREGPCGQLAR